MVGACIGGMIALPVLHLDTETTRMAVSGLADIASNIALIYIGGSIIDHSNVLGLVGQRIARIRG